MDLMKIVSNKSDSRSGSDPILSLTDAMKTYAPSKVKQIDHNVRCIDVNWGVNCTQILIKHKEKKVFLNTPVD